MYSICSQPVVIAPSSSPPKCNRLLKPSPSVSMRSACLCNPSVQHCLPRPNVSALILRAMLCSPFSAYHSLSISCSGSCRRQHPHLMHPLWPLHRDSFFAVLDELIVAISPSLPIMFRFPDRALCRHFPSVSSARLCGQRQRCVSLC